MKLKAWKNPGLPPAAAAERAEDLDSEGSAEVYATYQRLLAEANALDFGDLLLLTVELFERFPEVLRHYQERWQYVLVDEYQDTNRVQYRLVNQLAGGHRNLCVVGDPDQSIYRWRGADVRNILVCERDFPDAKVVKLERNYRSTQRILSGAGAVVENNPGRPAKRMITDRGEGERIAVVRGARRSRRGAVRGARHPRRRARARLLVRPVRRLLPHERAVAAARGRAAQVRRALRQVFFLIVYPIVFLVITFAYEILELWLGFEFAQKSHLILQFLAIGVIMNCISLIPTIFFEGIGKPKIITLIVMMELPFYLSAMWFAIHSAGIDGAALVFMVAATVNVSILYFIAYRYYEIKLMGKLKGIIIVSFFAVLILPLYCSKSNFKIITCNNILCNFLHSYLEDNSY